MERRPISVDAQDFPTALRPLLRQGVYDSSCSPAARVYFLEAEGGCYLKRAKQGSLKKEAELTAYFHGRGLAARVLAYESLEEDWLLTARLPGEDCTAPAYLAQPNKLSALLGEVLRQLHELDPAGCPPSPRMADYAAIAGAAKAPETCDLKSYAGICAYPSREAAWEKVQRCAGLLQGDTLLHGDYCLPNVLLDRWQFSGFVDLDGAGVGDRHVDLFWGIWSLAYNLKTGAYTRRFLDAYGRDAVEEEKLSVIAAFEVFG